MYRLLAVICLAQGVYGISVFYLFDPFYLFQRPHIILCQSKGTDHLDIEELLFIKIGVPGIPHIRLRRPYSGKKRNSDCHNEKNGHKSSEAGFYFHEKIFSQCFFTHM